MIIFFLLIRPPPGSTGTDTLLLHASVCRSIDGGLRPAVFLVLAYPREGRSTGRAPVGRRVLSAGSRFSLSGTSCPDSSARHPWRAWRDPRPPGHGSPRRQLGHFGFNKCRDDELPARRPDQIGRASCRERVCQYV